jgi:hypothetical protein
MCDRSSARVVLVTRNPLRRAAAFDAPGVVDRGDDQRRHRDVKAVFEQVMCRVAEGAGH